MISTLVTLGWLALAAPVYTVGGFDLSQAELLWLAEENYRHALELREYMERQQERLEDEAAEDAELVVEQAQHTPGSGPWNAIQAVRDKIADGSDGRDGAAELLAPRVLTRRPMPVDARKHFLRQAYHPESNTFLQDDDASGDLSFSEADLALHVFELIDTDDDNLIDLTEMQTYWLSL